jgi:hypothetical protein
VRSRTSPEHFREHWLDASRGTTAEGAEVVATRDADAAGEAAHGVVLEAVEVRD